MVSIRPSGLLDQRLLLYQVTWVWTPLYSTTTAYYSWMSGIIHFANQKSKGITFILFPLPQQAKPVPIPFLLRARAGQPVLDLPLAIC